MHRLLVALALGACGGPVKSPSPSAPPERYVVGTWSASTTSYADASSSRLGIRIAADGTFENGTFDGPAFQPAKRSTDFTAKLVLDPASSTIRFLNDGAEESARYTLEPPDRWKTDTLEGERVTVYYVRRR